jgi:hypothetical protein
MEGARPTSGLLCSNAIEFKLSTCVLLSYTLPLFVHYFLKPLTWLVSGGVLFWTSLCPILPFKITF